MDTIEDLISEMAKIGVQVDETDEITKSTNDDDKVELSTKRCFVVKLPNGQKIVICPR